MTAPLDAQAMRERHHEGYPAVPTMRICVPCRQPWPCDAIQALDALQLAERVVGAAREEHGEFPEPECLVCKALAAHDAEVGR